MKKFVLLAEGVILETLFAVGLIFIGLIVSILICRV
jgi:hypothetical protein